VSGAVCATRAMKKEKTVKRGGGEKLAG